MAGGHTAIDEPGEGLNGAAVCSHPDVLKDESPMQEEEVVCVGVELGGELGTGGGVGGGLKGVANVNGWARHGGIAEGLP